MPYEWDEAKRFSNLAKHGVDFASVEFFEWNDALVMAALSADEPRLVAFGVIVARLHVLVFGIETMAVRLISLRKANRREIKFYEQA